MTRSRAVWWLSAGACLVLTGCPAGREDGSRGGGSGRSQAAREIFGDDVVDHYLNAAKVEQEQYDAVVHDWDRERYLERS